MTFNNQGLFNSNAFLSKYKFMHEQEGSYATTSINQLPDTLTYILGLYKQDKIELYNSSQPFIVTDYGCGKSILSNTLIYILSFKKDEIVKFKEEKISVQQMVDFLFPDIKEILEQAEDNPKQILALYKEHKLDTFKLQKFDPAIGEYASVPELKADFLICNDVLEHIPKEDIDEILKLINSLGSNIYINACLRPAVNILPNGDNPHCTLKTMNWWKDKFEQNLTPKTSQGICRDLTSILILNFEPDEDTINTALNLFSKYGEIDLISFPHPEKEYMEEPLFSRLKNMQPLKNDIRKENIEYYKDTFGCDISSFL